MMTDREYLEKLTGDVAHTMRHLHWAVNGGLDTAAKKAPLGTYKSEIRRAVGELQNAVSFAAADQRKSGR